jgi:hypothetical protein
MSKKIKNLRQPIDYKFVVKRAFDELYGESKRVHTPFYFDSRDLKSLVDDIDGELAKAIEQPESINPESLESISGILSSIDALVARKEQLQNLLNQQNKELHQNN